MLKKLLAKWVNLLTGIALTALFLTILINAIEIFLRFVFDHSFYWIQDVTLLGMMWFIFPGIVKIIYSGQGIVIDFVINRLPEKVLRFVTIIADLITLQFMLFLSWQSWLLMVHRFGKVMATSQLPMPWYMLAIALSATTMSLIYCIRLFDGIRPKALMADTAGGS